MAKLLQCNHLTQKPVSESLQNSQPNGGNELWHEAGRDEPERIARALRRRGRRMSGTCRALTSTTEQPKTCLEVDISDPANKPRLASLHIEGNASKRYAIRSGGHRRGPRGLWPVRVVESRSQVPLLAGLQPPAPPLVRSVPASSLPASCHKRISRRSVVKSLQGTR